MKVLITDELKNYLEIGKEYGLLTLKEFDIADEEYKKHFADVSSQYPLLNAASIAARAVYRCLTHHGSPVTTPPVLSTSSNEYLVALTAKKDKRRAILFATLKVLWAIIVLFLLSAIAVKAGPPPEPNKDAVFLRGLHNAFGIPDPPDQPNGLIIQFQNQGTVLTTRAAGLVAINCSTNMTCSLSGSTLNLVSTNTASTAFSAITASANANVGTFSASGNTWDFTAATLFKLRAGAGLTASANGDFGFDSTNGNWHGWNGADRLFVPLASGFVSGHCGQPTSTAGKWEFVDTGAACGTGAAAAWASLTAGTNSNAGTFAVSGNSWDFTLATIFKARLSAGLTTSVNGDFGQNSTDGVWHFWENGADRFGIFSTNKGTLGQVALSNADGTLTFADPIVSGPDAPGAAPTKNPVQMGAFDGANVQRVKSDTSGNLNVNAIQSTPASLTNAWPVKPTDGTNPITVKPGSTASIVGDTAQVVALSPNTPLPAGGNSIGALSPNQSVNVNQYGGALTSLGQKNSGNSIPVVPANDFLPSDTIGSTGALNGANAAVTVTVTGQQGAGFYIIAGGSLQGRLLPEVSYNGAVGPFLSSLFYNPSTGAVLPFLDVNSPTDIYLTVLTPSGTSNARVRVSSYTGGTSNAVMRATFSMVDPLPFLSSNPVGTEFGVVTRNIPSGTQTVAGSLNSIQSGVWTVQPGNTANTTPWLATINQGGNSASVNASGQLIVDCAAGCASSAPADVLGSGTLGAVGNTAQIVMAGVNSASFSLPASNNLIATIVADSSTDGGTTWTPTLIRQQGSSSFWASSITVSSQNSNWDILVPGGSSHVRVRIPNAGYISGSTTASLRATQQPEAFAASVGAAGSAVPQGVTQIGGSDGSNLRALSTDATGKANVLIQANASINEAQVAGTAKSVNNGTTDAGTTRVTISSDSTGQVKETNFPATVDTNNGATSASTPRVTISNDSTGQVVPAPTTASADAVSACNILSAASTNSTSCKGSAGNFYGYEIFNTTTTIYYLRLYNTAAAPTCSSATGFIRSIPIPPAAAAGQAGGAISNQGFPVNYGTGIGYCITGGSGSTDNTSAATGIFGEIRFK